MKHYKKNKVFGFGVLCLLFTSCVNDVGPITCEELNSRILAHETETVNWVDYMGSKDGYNYLYHNYTWGSKIYCISEKKFPINDPFPYTEDSKKWRPLKKHWELWPYGTIKTEQNTSE